MNLRSWTSVRMCALALVGTALLWPTSTKAQEIASGALLAGTCFSCHGPSGDSVGIIDALAGQPANGTVKKMNEFKKGEKPSTVMGRIAKGYNDAEIAAMAAFFEKQPKPK